ncbi:MAG TPA: TlpA disulfide reductase family protein [Pyrinomonadaceae bacterium]|nr:TlpA disulfide reductase family protein [Pyrinomonadaceae bacterium]
MKFALTLAFILTSVVASFGQNEQSPIVEKDIAYKDWDFKNVQTGQDMNLRKFTNGKKLVMVVYFAPWCPNWKHDLPMVQQFYDKYRDKGFDVIAVGEYDPVDAMKKHIEQYKLTFPIVWESDLRTAKQTTSHYEYRRSTGDTRNWGSPWYIFLEVGKLETNGLVMTKRTSVVNGELIQPEADKFIREKLGLPAGGEAKLTSQNATEVCDPEKPAASALAKPDKKP